MTGFDPKTHGFRFSNTFHNSPFGPPINVVTGGLCGGMSYTVLDYFLAGLEVPKQNYRPAHNTDFQIYIYRRQETSLLLNLDKWVAYHINPFGTKNLEIFNWGLREKLAELRTYIDRGVPVPLGLKGTGGDLVGKDHQVLAIGYDMGRYAGDVGANKEDVKIYLCEPNHPGEVITMVPDPAKMEFYYKEHPETRWRSYFVDASYVRMTPPTVTDFVDPDAAKDGLVHALKFQFTTGVEELRGGNLHVNLKIRFKDGTQQEYQDISHGGRWISNYTETIEVVLTIPRRLEDIQFLEIKTNNTVGDRWDLAELDIDVIGGGFTRSKHFKDAAPYKFMGLPQFVVPK